MGRRRSGVLGDTWDARAGRVDGGSRRRRTVGSPGVMRRMSARNSVSDIPRGPESGAVRHGLLPHGLLPHGLLPRRRFGSCRAPPGGGPDSRPGRPRRATARSTIGAPELPDRRAPASSSASDRSRPPSPGYSGWRAPPPSAHRPGCFLPDKGVPFIEFGHGDGRSGRGRSRQP